MTHNDAVGDAVNDKHDVCLLPFGDVIFVVFGLVDRCYRLPITVL